MTQASSCPFKLTDLEIMDQRLKEFVHLHHLDLLRKVKYRVNKLKDHIQEKQLYKQLSYYYLSKEQVRTGIEELCIVYLSYSLV